MKKTFFIFLSIVSFFLGTIVFVAPQEVSFADDEEHEEDEDEDEEDDEDDEEDDERDQDKENEKESRSISTSQPPRSVPVTTTTLKSTTTTFKDTDGDGLYDNEDPHPTIPELYIVRDENRNGITDSFEIPSS